MYQRVVRGLEAGAITAGAVETAFFVLDLVRLQPLATPATLAGAGLSPGGAPVDLTSIAGVASVGWAVYQLWLLTLAHFGAYALAGVAASLLFDWTRLGGVGRFGALTAFCGVALLVAVALSGSLVNLAAVGAGTAVGMLLLAPAILAAMLRVLWMPEKAPAEEPA